jgi:purine-binding chemotaxis protein CheW
MTVLHVVFKIAGADYALAAADVLHMESFTGATRVPGTPPFIAGLVQVRGRVLPVIDLRVRFGLEPITPSLDSRVVVVQSGSRAVGLLADSAREVLKIDPGDFREAPEMVADTTQGLVKAVAQVRGRFLMLVDLPKVIGEERIDVQ